MAPVPISPVIVGHIDDVQELRKAKPTTVPERFVRDLTERPTMATALSSATDIPIINFSKLIKGNPDEFHSEILNLSTACEQWGFFQVQIYCFNIHVEVLVKKKVMMELIFSYFFSGDQPWD